MSFILDALKKSETERQQQGNAEFAGVPRSSGAKPGRKWIWLVGLLLAVNLAVLLGLLLRSSADSESLAANGQPQEAIVEKFEDSGLRAVSFADQVATARRNAAPQQIEEIHSEASVANPLVASSIEPIVVSENTDSIRSTAIYPTIHAVRASGAISIPDLHLDIHVYSEAPEDRFVFINMSKHREGSQLEEGPVVDRITADGVVLGHRGISFLLPRE